MRVIKMSDVNAAIADDLIGVCDPVEYVSAGLCNLDSYDDCITDVLDFVPDCVGV